MKMGFNRSLSEPTLYIKLNSNDILIVSLYVDDLLVTGSNHSLIKQFKTQILQEFQMIDLGEMVYFLGMEIKQSQKGIFISQ